MTIALWQPPRFLKSFDDAAIWNAIVSWGGKPIPVSKTMAAEFSVEQAPDPAIRGHLLRPEAGPEFLAVPLSFPFQSLFGADMDIDAIERLPATLAHRLDQGVITTLWGALPDNRMGSVRIAASGAIGTLLPGRDISGLQWLRAVITGIATEPAVVLVGGPMTDMARAVSGGAFAPRPVAGAIGAKLTTDICFMLGCLTLTVGEFAALSPGDVVVLAAQNPDITRLRTARTTYLFHRQDKGWGFAGTEGQERFRPSAGLSEGFAGMQDDAPTHGSQGLSVMIDFDLGSLTIPLSVIESWQPGTVVPLEPPVLGDGVEVTVRANGQVVGSGDLVRIDDRIAVRLTRLMHGQKA